MTLLFFFNISRTSLKFTSFSSGPYIAILISCGKFSLRASYILLHFTKRSFYRKKEVISDINLSGLSIAHKILLFVVVVVFFLQPIFFLLKDIFARISVPCQVQRCEVKACHSA